jgi:hypothetical protein
MGRFSFDPQAIINDGPSIQPVWLFFYMLAQARSINGNESLATKTSTT